MELRSTLGIPEHIIQWHTLYIKLQHVLIASESCCIRAYLERRRGWSAVDRSDRIVAPRTYSRETMAFLNFLLAEALAAGLERAAAQDQREQQLPPPPNFFVLPRDPRAWRKFHEACKKENMVIAIEITDNSKAYCKRVQSLFMSEARKFESIPFVRVEIESGLIYKEVCARI